MRWCCTSVSHMRLIEENTFYLQLNENDKARVTSTQQSLPISETDIYAHFSVNNELLHGFLQKERVALTYSFKVCAAEILTHVSEEKILEAQRCIVAQTCCVL